MFDEFEEYYRETDPVKRKEILDELVAAPGHEQQLAQIRALFPIRYEANRQGGYNDLFIGCMLTLRDIAYNSGGSLRKKQNTEKIRETVHTLCLDRGDEFSKDILYRELYNLVTDYVDSCYEDHQYNSVVFGLGWMRSDALLNKVRNDLTLIAEQIPEYLGEQEGYPLFGEVIRDVMDQQLTPDPRRSRE